MRYLHMVAFDLTHEAALYLKSRTGRGGRFLRAVEQYGDDHGL